ncbi:MAG TPA: nuclease-related domain-containing protein [Candidatus Paceibacterota bacterium]
MLRRTIFKNTADFKKWFYLRRLFRLHEIFGSRGSKYFMARFYGKPSEYLIRNEQDNRNLSVRYVFIIAIVAIACFVVSYLIFKHFLINSIAVGILVLLYFIARISKQKSDRYQSTSDKFYHGIKGEGSIFYELLKLSNSYIVFQDISMEKANIDFVVVGPTGIFTIEVKSHKGSVSFEEYSWLRKNIWQAKSQALFLHNFFLEKIKKDYFVNPVLVFSSFWARLKFGLKPQGNVIIV